MRYPSEHDLQIVSLVAESSQDFCLVPAKILVRLQVFFKGELTATNHNKAPEVCISFWNRCEYWTSPMQMVALWISK